MSGANYGVVPLWAIALGAFLKFVLNEGIARWQLATGLTALEGWAEYLPSWVEIYFGVYLVCWTVAVSAALTNATGLPHHQRRSGGGEHTINPWVSLVNNLQHDTVSGGLGWQMRFRWIRRPWNDLYVVYTRNWREQLEPGTCGLATIDSRLASKIVYTLRF